MTDSEQMRDGPCPEVAEVPAACRGELPPQRVESLLDHALGCHACSEAWRLARRERAQSATAAAPDSVPPRASPGRRVRWIVVTAVAVLVLALLTPRVLQRISRAAERSGVETGAIVPLIDGDEPLSRDSLVLRWSPGPHGTLYAIEVLTEDRDVVDRNSNLPRPEYWVPVERLGGVPPGTTLSWRVGAVYPDGSRVESETHRVVVN